MLLCYYVLIDDDADDVDVDHLSSISSQNMIVSQYGYLNQSYRLTLKKLFEIIDYCSDFVEKIIGGASEMNENHFKRAICRDICNSRRILD